VLGVVAQVVGVARVRGRSASCKAVSWDIRETVEKHTRIAGRMVDAIWFLSLDEFKGDDDFRCAFLVAFECKRKQETKGDERELFIAKPQGIAISPEYSCT